MTDSRALPATESYAPHRRTALVLTGTGTDGAYHAGVLRALHESGVKIDVVAGRGVGVLGAVFAAIDAGSHLWSEKGYWRSPGIELLYGWRGVLRAAVGALAISLLVLAVPMFVVALGLVVFPLDFIVKVAGLAGTGGPASAYMRLVERAFAPEAFPTWLPRIVLLVLGAAAVGILAAGPWRGRERNGRGAIWWRFVTPPLSADSAIERAWPTLWTLLRGATSLKQPPIVDLARRYVEMLTENLGQPGFRELVFVAHDMDARRDVVFALVAESRRRELVRRPTTAEMEIRRAEVLDLSGAGRDHLVDGLAAALTVPVATSFHTMTFAADGYWRGESHRLSDRPGGLERVLEEVAELGVEQVVLVSGSADSPGPHALAVPRLDGRGRLGEVLRSTETAAFRDVSRRARPAGPRLFAIRPAHNPVGPFDFAGGFDDRSARTQSLLELMTVGYEDAYRQFIEPVVGASGDRVGHAG